MGYGRGSPTKEKRRRRQASINQEGSDSREENELKKSSELKKSGRVTKFNISQSNKQEGDVGFIKKKNKKRRKTIKKQSYEEMEMEREKEKEDSMMEKSEEYVSSVDSEKNEQKQ